MGWLGHLSYDSVIGNSVNVKQAFILHVLDTEPTPSMLFWGKERGKACLTGPEVWIVENLGIHDLASRCVLLQGPGAEGCTALNRSLDYTDSQQAGFKQRLARRGQQRAQEAERAMSSHLDLPPGPHHIHLHCRGSQAKGSS